MSNMINRGYIEHHNKQGQWHNDNGSVIIFASGSNSWCIIGVEYTEEFKQFKIKSFIDG